MNGRLPHIFSRWTYAFDHYQMEILLQLGFRPPIVLCEINVFLLFL